MGDQKPRWVGLGGLLGKVLENNMRFGLGVRKRSDCGWHCRREGETGRDSRLLCSLWGRWHLAWGSECVVRAADGCPYAMLARVHVRHLGV